MTERNSLPPGFITTAEAAERRRFSIRTARNRCLDHGIGIKVGHSWWVYIQGLNALERNDTGELVDAQRHVRNMNYAD